MNNPLHLLSCAAAAALLLSPVVCQTGHPDDSFAWKTDVAISSARSVTVPVEGGGAIWNDSPSAAEANPSRESVADFIRGAAEPPQVSAAAESQDPKKRGGKKKPAKPT